MLSKYKANIEGVTPFLHGNPEILADPEHPLSDEYREINRKKGKKQFHYKRLAEIQWLYQWYLNENDIPVIPRKCIKGMLVEAGKQFRLGSKIKSSCVFYDSILFNGGVNLSNYKDLKDDPNYRSREMAVNRKTPGSGIIIFTVYPRVMPWSATVNILFEDSMISAKAIDEILVYAGRFCSIGTKRPDYGKFDVKGKKK